MANRRISDLQELAGIDLADQDLFTVVRVGEVDPELKNKKLTISGTKQYLNTYYLPSSGGTITGNTLINGNLNVSGLTTLSGLAVNNQASVSGLIVQNNATVSGVISGSTFTGNTIHGTNINGTTITATTLSVIGSGNVASGLSAQYFNLNTTGVATNVTNGLFAPTGNTVGFSVNAVERARINSLGRVGVNTTAMASLAHIAGDTLVSNVDMVNASYANIFLLVSSQDTSPNGLSFSLDGRKMFITGSTRDNVYEYTLSTPWNVSTAVYVTLFSIAAQEPTVQEIYFRKDGRKFYIVGGVNDVVYQYSLSTPWSIETASYDNISFSVTAQEPIARGLYFKPNGLVFYIVGVTSKTVFRYDLSTAWDVSTATLTDSFNVTAYDNNFQSVEFTLDGSRMFLLGNQFDAVHIFNLTTAWDITTAIYSTLFSIGAQEDQPRSIYIRPDGTSFYLVGNTNASVYQYTIPSVTINLTGNTNAYGNLNVSQNLSLDGEIVSYGDLIFSTAPTAGTATEQLRILTQGTLVCNQSTPAVVDVTATLTVANLITKIITSSTALAVTMTLPTGTLMDIAFGKLYINMAFEWCIINTGATNAVTVAVGATHTLVGSSTVAAGNSGRFLSRRTATATWVTYRLAS